MILDYEVLVQFPVANVEFYFPITSVCECAGSLKVNEKDVETFEIHVKSLARCGPLLNFI